MLLLLIVGKLSERAALGDETMVSLMVVGRTAALQADHNPTQQAKCQLCPKAVHHSRVAQVSIPLKDNRHQVLEQAMAFRAHNPDSGKHKRCEHIAIDGIDPLGILSILFSLVGMEMAFDL